MKQLTQAKHYVRHPSSFVNADGSVSVVYSSGGDIFTLGVSSDSKPSVSKVIYSALVVLNEWS